MAAPAYRSAGTQAGVTSGNITCTPPAGVADDDILLAVFTSNDTVTTALAGWTVVDTADATGDTLRQQVLWKRASSESGNYTFTRSGGGPCSAQVFAFSGADTSALVINAHSSKGGNAGSPTTSVASNACTPTVDGCLLVFTAAVDDNTIRFSAQAGGSLTWTEQADAGNGTSQLCVMLATAPQTTQAAVSPTATTSSANVFVTVTLAIAPLSAGGGSTDAEYDAQIGLAAEFSGVTITRPEVVASVSAGITSASRCALGASVSAPLIITDSLSARAAAQALIVAGFGAGEAQALLGTQLGAMSAQITATAATQALAQTLGAVISALRAGERWAAHAQAAAAFASSGILGAIFLAETQSAQDGALSAHTRLAADFLAGAEALASLTERATLADGITAALATLGELTSGTEFGASFAYLSGNPAFVSSGLSITAVLEIMAAAIGSLAAGTGLTALLSARATTHAALDDGIAFGAAFAASGGVGQILPPARETLRVAPSSRSLRVAPRNRSTRLH